MTTTPRSAAPSPTTHPTDGLAAGVAPGAHLVHWLDASDEPTGGIAALGGKAASLVRLLRAGLPVPPGFVILPAAFEMAAEAGTARLTPEAATQVAAAYDSLARTLGEAEPAVAVRSSASAEDLAGASFAGQYDTYLGVRGAGAVLEYAARCAASLWSARAAAYRAQREAAGQSLPEGAMAVVVQALIDADAAGVAFSADPITADARHVIVNGCWGLGQSIVDGEVEGDTWRVERASLAIVQESIGLKATRTAPEPGAPRVPVPEAVQRQPCLAPEQVAEIARLVLRAEQMLGRPADVEWALAGGQIAVLQARPITALQPAAPTAPAEPAAQEAPRGPTPAFPFEWPDLALPATHWRLEGGTDATPARPWEEDERAANGRAGRAAAELLGGERYRRAIYLNGYRYTAEETFSATAEERERRRVAFERPVDALAEHGLTYWEAVLLPEIDESDRRFDGVDPDGLSAAALAAHLDEVLKWYERLWLLHSFALRTIRGRPNTFRQRLTALCRQITGDTGETGEAIDDRVATLLAHVPNKLSEAIDGLIELAGIVQQRAPLRHLFETEAAPAILTRLGETEGGPTFQAQLERLLAEQALRSDAGAFTVRRGSQPGWRDRPELVVTLVQRYVPQDLDALARGQAAAVAARDAQVAALRAAIPDETTRRQFDGLLDGARREARAYEDHNYYIDCAAGALLHRALMAAARRLAGAGTLSSPDDVWWLRHHEIAAVLQALDAAATNGRAPRWNLLVESRKTLHEWQRSLTPPDWLGAPPPPAPVAPSAAAAPAAGATSVASAPPAATAPAGSAGPRAGTAPPSEQPVPANVLIRGQAGSRGVATGRVRLVPRDALVPEVAPGDVLVAHNAGVLWTPVFPVAAAVVLDEGVLFQHAMLTCREYGVPGIFQAKQATTVLHEGQLVTVDGTNGWVLPAEMS